MLTTSHRSLHNLTGSILLEQVRKLVSMTSTKHPVSVETADISPAPEGSRAKRRRLNGPDPGSLCGIMRQYRGTPLYVMPICWTDQHSHLLNATWTQMPPSLTPVPSLPAKAQHKQPSKTASTLSRELTTLLSSDVTRPLMKSRAIKDVLKTFFPDTMCRPRSTAELDLHFGARVIKRAIRLQVLWKSPDIPIRLASFDSVATLSTGGFASQPSQHTSQQHSRSTNSLPNPFLAYLSRSQLHTVRQHLFRIVPHPKLDINAPVSRLQQLRSKMLNPADPDKDAVFVAILIAIAQKQLYSATEYVSSTQSTQNSQADNEKSIPAFRDIKAQLLTHDDETADFIVYTAIVSAGLLKKFHFPNRISCGASPSDGIDISFTRVPIWPVLGLKERLGKALGPEIAGEIKDNDFETWGMDFYAHSAREVNTAQPDSSLSPHSQDSKSSQSFLDSQSSLSSSTSSPRGLKRRKDHEPLLELLNRSLEEKKTPFSARALSPLSLKATLESPHRESVSVSLTIPSPVAMASPTKRRRISDTRKKSRASEVDVSV